MLVSNLRGTLLSLSDNLEAGLSKSAREAQANAGPSSTAEDIAVDSAGSGLVLSMAECYGSNQVLLARKTRGLAGQCEEFIRRFGDGPVRILRAPARINILGEHIDYVSYIPTASLTFGSREHDMVMMLRPSSDDLVRGASTDSRFEDFEFHLGNRLSDPATAAPPSQWLSYLYSRPAPAAHWANYAEGACRFAQIKYGARISAGFDSLIDSSVPPGGGASSSSALSVLAGAAVRLINGISYEPEDLALDSSQAEWYVGTRGGSMDHTTILLARPDSAIQISYSNGRSRLVPLHGAYSWVTFFTHPANKSQEVMNQYNERALTSRILIPAILSGWESSNPSRSRSFADGVNRLARGDLAGLESIEAALRELPDSVGVGHVGESYPAAFEQARQTFPALIEGAGSRQFQVRIRALHHVGEVKRVARATELLSSPRGREEAGQTARNEAAAAIGALLQESHRSLRDLYEVSTPEVEELVAIITGSGLAFGARMMGGGFGGNVLALVAAANSPALIEFVQREYYSPRNRDALQEGSVMISTAGPGLSEITCDTVGSY
jgi:galactokinase